MTWLVWRQHRKQLLFGVAALLVLGAFFVGTGRPIHDRYEALGLADCMPAAMDATVVVDTDALARREFLSAMVDAVAETAMTVVLSSISSPIWSGSATTSWC